MKGGGRKVGSGGRKEERREERKEGRKEVEREVRKRNSKIEARRKK